MRDLEQRSGVGRETIRYYIGLGLLPEPARPKPNVADYGEEHVSRLLAIKRLQAERYLPLSFIRTLLDRPSHGEMSPIPGFADLLGPLLGAQSEGPATPLAEAADATGLPIAEIQVLIEAGVLFAVTDPQGGQTALAPPDLAVARAWGRVRAAGYTPDAGFFPEDTALYAEALAPMVRREVDRFFTRVTGGRSPEAAATLAQAGVRDVNDLIAAMRTNYILRRVAELGAAGGPPDGGA